VYSLVNLDDFFCRGLHKFHKTVISTIGSAFID
jgi:hypothetical protein